MVSFNQKHRALPLREMKIDRCRNKEESYEYRRELVDELKRIRLARIHRDKEEKELQLREKIAKDNQIGETIIAELPEKLRFSADQGEWGCIIMPLDRELHWDPTIDEAALRSGSSKGHGEYSLLPKLRGSALTVANLLSTEGLVVYVESGKESEGVKIPKLVAKGW
jgi:hypothetical protein